MISSIGTREYYRRLGFAPAHTAANGDAVEYGFAAVLVNEAPQILFRHANDQDRLLVLYNPNTLDAPTEIDTDQAVDRLAGVGRDLQDVFG